MSGKTEDGMIPESEMTEDALQHMHECIAVVNGLIQQFDARILAGVLTSQAAKLYARLMAAGYYSQDQIFDVGMQFIERAIRRVDPPKIIHVNAEEFAASQPGDTLVGVPDKSKLN